jgi:hypothetical protein
LLTACLVGAYFRPQGGKGRAYLTRKSMDNLHHLAMRKLSIWANASARFAAWLWPRWVGPSQLAASGRFMPIVIG